MSREKKLFRNSIILALGTVLPKLANFLILPILTGYLSKIEYGSYDLILTSLYFVLPIISLQIEQGSFRFLIDAKTTAEKTKVISTSTAYVTLVSVLMYVAGLIALRGFSPQLKQLILLFSLANLFYTYLLQINRGLKQLKVYSIMALTNSFSNVVFIILFIWKMRLGLVGLLLSLNISILISIVLGFGLGKVGLYLSFTLFTKSKLRELLLYSIPLLPNAISWWIIGLSDRWIITSFLGLELTAIYAIANKIPDAFNFIYRNFNLAWQESASLAIEDDDIDLYYSSVFETLFNFSVGSILLLITASPVIFKILIDSTYASAYYQMPILFVAVFFGVLASFFGGIYIAFKQSKKLGLSAFFAAVINILINLIFVKTIGLYAASLSTLISYLVILIYRIIDIRKIVLIKYNHRKIALGIFLIIIISVIAYLNNFHLNIVNFVTALIVALFFNKDLIEKLRAKISFKKH